MHLAQIVVGGELAQPAAAHLALLELERAGQVLLDAVLLCDLGDLRELEAEGVVRF